MVKKLANGKSVWVVTPFERPDVRLFEAAAKAGAFPVLHLGRDRGAAEKALGRAAPFTEEFGVCIADEAMLKTPLPENVSRIILPWGMKAPRVKGAGIVWQVNSEAEAKDALAAKAKMLIFKGCESAGLCGDDSAFILFQKLISVCNKADVPVIIQGGVGVHTGAAYMALGASGVIIDSQTALLPECELPHDFKAALGRLSGNEIRSCEGYHYYMLPGSKENGAINGLDDLYPRIAAGDGNILPLGQDVILAPQFATEYKRLKNLVRVIDRASTSHVKQARVRDPFEPGGRSAKAIRSEYPLIQGPMARISDVPGFLRSVSDGGALPFLAMSMLRGDEAKGALEGAVSAMDGRPWGVGILGFIQQKTVTEQMKLIMESKPAYVIIAGARPGQPKSFEDAGIKALLHAPTSGVFDMFHKEGATRFIFEGRESGGHVGPLCSCVLWERQIHMALNSGNTSELKIFFAGGIHDAFSAAFVRIMAGPLAMRGAKIGLMCGTAYLYTEEAVSSGAIPKAYQRLLIEKDETLLLKSGSGQETRCVSTPFTDFFLNEKARMEAEGLEPADVMQRLEELNLGRLRIASKGIARDGAGFVTLTEEEQIEQGLYMTGTITEFTKKTTTMAALNEALCCGSLELLPEVEQSEPVSGPDPSRDIAIIGMAGIFPGAENLDEFWRNILFGADCISEVPEDRWPVDLFFDPETTDTDHVVSKWGGFIGKTDFNALEFGITPQSIASIEPVQLLSLLIAKRALQDAGFDDLAAIDLEDTTVIFGAEGAGELTTDYLARTSLMELLGQIPQESADLLPRITEDSFPGILSNVISGRISNRLNTGGRNFTVDAACAASLAALDIAFSELTSKKADMVILGGADLHNGINDYLLFGSAHALSKKGHCSTFDADADGIVISEGVAAIILKRLSDAKRDGNKIYAVIKGVGGSSDGKSLGLTAPSSRGQILALERAYENAGLKPSEVGMVETHGTGTAVGDIIELQALNHVFWEDGALPGHTSIGSLKSLIGHTKCASGIAGLIKAVLCVRHGILPPTLHLHNPNRVFTKEGPFCVRTEKSGYWRDERRIAGVSGFGFGGANFHAIVQNYERGWPETTLKSWPSELFVFPGDSEQEAQKWMGKVRESLAVNDQLRLVDISYSLARKCEGKAVQYVIVAGTREELIDRMKAAESGEESEDVYRLKPVPGKVAFLFPGQGSQRVNMAADLFVVFPHLRKLLKKMPGYEQILFPVSVFTEEEKNAQQDAITDTRNAQPLLGIVDIAIASTLTDFGIEPDMVAGHSYGEMPALCFAGAIETKDLAVLSRKRAESILSNIGEDRGRMAAALTDVETLTGLIEGLTDIWPVNYNSPRQTVVAGTGPGMEAFLNKAKEAGVPCKELNVACAFHSPLLHGASHEFKEVADGYKFHSLKIPMMSNLDAGPYPKKVEDIKKRMTEGLEHPVLFVDEIKNMNEDGAAVFVEAGPGGSLTKLASEILKGKDAAFIQTERAGVNGLTFLLQGLAKYISTGRMIKLDELYSGRDAKPINIDEPEANKKEGLIWKIDGRASTSESADFPGPTLNPQKALSAWLQASGMGSGLPGAPGMGGVSVEHVMMSYLDNMNAMIQDQRDVMLGYLGAGEAIPRGEPARRQFAIAGGSSTAESVEYAEEEAEDGGGADLLDIPSMSSDEITNLIFEIVSEKTGYPTSMLELDTDLEADLSIDSIKKMEIIGGLQNRVQMPTNEEDMELLFEKIISVRTFRDLTAWIQELGAATISGGGAAAEDGESGAAGSSADAGPEKATSEAPEGVTRMIFKRREAPLEEKDPGLIAGKSFAVTEDGGGIAAGVAKLLAEAGAEAQVLDIGASTDLTAYEGLVLISSSAGKKQYSVMDLFKVLKKADMEKLGTVIAFDDSLARIEQEATDPEKWASVELPDGFPGFLKTLSLEYPDKRFCAIQLERPCDAEGIAAMIADEAIAAGLLPEVYYRDGQRSVIIPEMSTVDTGGEGATGLLEKDSVVLALGGAQGITAHIVTRLAKDFPCRYILAGRSEQDPECEKYASCDTVDAVRKALIEEGELKQPKEIEAKAKALFKSSRIAAVIANIEEAGGKAEYRCADVADAKAFGGLLADIRKEYGRIDGVVHAAGILEDKLFKDKTAVSFKRVYDTKTVPLKAIIEKLLPDLKLLVLFSSVSSTFGSAGQCDYAAGNSVFDRTALALARSCPEIRTVAFNWGPWKGAGMVGSSLENEFNKRGIYLIELEAGCEFFANELMYGAESEVLGMPVSRKAAEDLMGKYMGSVK